MTNPAGARRQVLGVYSEGLVEPIAQVLAQLGSEHAMVVHGADGLDEITTTAATRVGEVRDGTVEVFDLEPESVGVERSSLEDLVGGEPEDNAAAMLRVFGGERSGRFGALTDITALNAGAALYVGGVATSLAEGVARARETIASGAATEKLDQLKSYREAS